MLVYLQCNKKKLDNNCSAKSRCFMQSALFYWSNIWLRWRSLDAGDFHIGQVVSGFFTLLAGNVRLSKTSLDHSRLGAYRVEAFSTFSLLTSSFELDFGVAYYGCWTGYGSLVEEGSTDFPVTGYSSYQILFTHQWKRATDYKLINCTAKDRTGIAERK